MKLVREELILILASLKNSKEDLEHKIDELKNMSTEEIIEESSYFSCLKARDELSKLILKIRDEIYDIDYKTVKKGSK
ncbi:MAG: hypothetical protein HUJ61_02920 [Bacilli bacterium]|nr:hypothetical protein [Bacilli bacterium]